MKHNLLGTTDIKVSEVCLGTMTWGSQNNQEEGFEQMDYAIENGVNFFDTAELYPVPPKADTKHRTETIIGNWFEKTGKRSDVILASKVKGGGISHIRDGSLLSPSDIDIALEGSLTRLKTDYIDLYQLHWPNRPTYNFANHGFSSQGLDANKITDQHLAILECLNGHVKSGKIRHFGVSDDTAWGVMTYLNLAKQHNLPRLMSIQNEYSLLCRWFDKDLKEIAELEKCGLLAWSPLATGVISGKYLDGNMPEKSRRAYSGGGKTFRDTPQTQRAVVSYINLAKEYDLDVCQMAIAFTLSRSFVTASIIGATTMPQLKNNIAAADVTLSKEVLDKIDQIWRDNAYSF
ncbi:MAG: aryl-alcohol dehydrogenase-like predicted oxidoreductase [Alphaproteobacteria bacterium]|jgi:aryl-alcohol dehydrogenase-like predicted oxidoreductase